MPRTRRVWSTWIRPGRLSGATAKRKGAPLNARVFRADLRGDNGSMAQARPGVMSELGDQFTGQFCDFFRSLQVHSMTGIFYYS